MQDTQNALIEALNGICVTEFDIAQESILDSGGKIEDFAQYVFQLFKDKDEPMGYLGLDTADIAVLVYQWNLHRVRPLIFEHTGVDLQDLRIMTEGKSNPHGTLITHGYAHYSHCQKARDLILTIAQEEWNDLLQWFFEQTERGC